MAEAQKKTNLDYVNEIWNIADYVRDVQITTRWYFRLHFFVDWNALLNQQELLYVMQ